MKIAVINNTNFGYKNNSKEISDMMFKYFNSDVIPKLKKNMDKIDSVVIIGDIFYNTSNICSSIFNKTQDILSEISNICKLVLITDKNTKDMFRFIPNIKFQDNFTESDYTISKSLRNNKYNLLGFTDISKIEDNNYHLPSPYQLTEDTNGNGFYVINTDKNIIHFIKNTSSPVFGTIKIDSFEELEDLDNTYISENKITLVINKILYDTNRTKLEFILSKLTTSSIAKATTATQLFTQCKLFFNYFLGLKKVNYFNRLVCNIYNVLTFMDK
jgi:hypothetical protein